MRGGLHRLGRVGSPAACSLRRLFRHACSGGGGRAQELAASTLAHLAAGTNTGDWVAEVAMEALTRPARPADW